MTKITIPSAPDPNRFAQRMDELRAALYQADPNLLAERTAAVYEPLEEGRGAFYLPLWDQQMLLSFPDFVGQHAATGQEVNPMDQTLLLYYFTTADGTPESGRWISFSELPDGRFYNQAFQGYTGHQLARVFQNAPPSFEKAAEILGGKPHQLGDASYLFQALPRVPLLVVFWQGDEDFPSSFQILFDSSSSHYLPTDAFAILGSTLTRRLIKAMAG